MWSGVWSEGTEQNFGVKPLETVGLYQELEGLGGFGAALGLEAGDASEGRAAGGSYLCPTLMFSDSWLYW